ncbi:creatininase family protein [Phytoactinopolyspora limicola]|uniref:creatininase family protein n=1 Tax=Phytoactinopolyspora limicola TaxID=2715536 RepID=UPI00140AB292|nr:creatininase family protein [Phytoactinopolyspora limicola]
MTVVSWADVNREVLTELLPEALVVLPVGAVEQHGPHLATGTDTFMAATVAQRAAERAEKESSRPLVIAPVLPFGASDHHLPFGGTLSLTPETLLAVLVDLLRSVAADGGRRVVLVNGHGGNVGICHAASAAAAARHEIAVAHVDYWRMAGPGTSPGHAGEFETSLVGAVRPELMGSAEPRDHVPEAAAIDGVEVHDAGIWAAMDGFTDRPDRADRAAGEARLDQIVDALAERLVALAKTM